MATYAELLQDENWLNKRKEILNRDKRICQKCNNEHYYSNFKKSAIINVVSEDDYILMQANKGDERFRDGVYKYTVEFLDEDHNAKNIKFYSIHYVKKTTYLNGYNLFYKESTDNEDNSKFEILCINNPVDSNDVFFCKDLHVHHKYYQKGIYPWQYPDEALTTLCWHCHEKLHENTEIDIYDENRNLIGRKKPCYKCHGAGFLPEYSYHMNGICFACNGERFR
jgi:hypothetical protein